MARAWNYDSGAIAVGTLPDPDPNVTPPADARIFDAPAQTERNGEASAIQWALDMNTAGTADVTVWIRDERTKIWFKADTTTAAGDKEVFDLVGVPGAKLFFQLTAPVTFTSVKVRAESVP